MVRPKKALGQHFLTDDNIARKIVAAIAPQPNDVIIEIGPGRGALTKHLLQHGACLIAVEIDAAIATELQHEYGSRVEIIHEDFLEVDLQRVSHRNGIQHSKVFPKSGEPFDNRLGLRSKIRLVGNIPYNITSPILFKAFENRAIIGDMVIMVQKEVAERIVAKPKTKARGILSVFAQRYSQPELLFSVSPNCFYPKPKVMSAVIRLDFQHSISYQVQDEALFTQIVKATFGKRRKTIRNGLKSLNLDEGIIDALGYNLNARPEELSVSDFVTLSNLLSERLTHLY
jgi:16S rRNA (adenine1518-N6/adenine1519-N6)-dimethyltransferase